MSNINYQVLREKAEKATKGSYIVGHTSVNQHGNLTGVFVCQKWKGEPGGVIAECHVNCLVETDAQAYANAEFIAEANPATVLALLDERERNLQYIKSRDQENEDIALTVGKLRVELEEVKQHAEELSETKAVRNQWRPDICPITGRAFFMWIEHPTLGNVPTYGGPLDSYTIPTKDGDGEFSCERYDHDFGGWVESECLGLYLIDDREQCRVYELEERVKELDAREISLPERSSMLHRTDFHDDYQTVMAYKVSEVIAAIRAAGIRIKGGE
ncbi:TPA: ead/Ea22-like family protein [Escherichia coli]|uniref:Ead/Ea22-like family protein n=12 Tax=Escherichia coli TaxID=562 RepID=A0AB73V0S3_ECOLX|nr:ead/Ea22-like family protein [Escherichia coli]EGD7621634.1 ead/Ea22-like family protein [Escherichia coli]EHX7548532.1 ead/Ea22-like family protein [Escherichia coli]EHZ4156949.1 ead/Ea22-like family protein [Escherichia coli]KDZ67372.1 ead/Ea22-like family protein [Escherichia coli 3-073-06_S1_C2]MBA0940665.1 ead/Ea22-like family protein [Escherichia coli]